MTTFAELRAESTLTGTGVQVTYSFLNVGTEDLYMYAHPDDGRRAEVLPGAYVCVSRQDDALHLLLGIPPPPQHYSVQRGVIPLARIVSPGGRVEGRVELDIPVREWSAYLPPDYPPECPTVLVDGGSLRVEHFPTSDAGWVEPGPVDGTFWTEAAQPRSVSAEFGFSESVPVLERTDPFVRF